MRLRVKPRFWVILIVISLIVFCAGIAVAQRRYDQGAERLRRMQEERDAIILRANALSDQLEFAKTDDYVIRVARDELNMIMPGEVRYVTGAR